MKKRDEIEEEEILDEEEEFLDDEEVLDDEEIDDDDFVDDEELDEEEDEKPSKKSKKAKKGGKKKLGKGAIIGISVSSVVAFLAIAVVLVMFVILPMIGNDVDASGAGSYTATIGAKKPNIAAGKVALKSSMNTGDMLLAAVENYYDADYAANICVIGGVKTTLYGAKVSQTVQSFKYRDGKGNPTDSTNKENAKYYCYSKSAGVANMDEEYYAEGATVKYRKFKDKSIKTEKREVTTANGKTQKVTFMTASAWQKTVTYPTVKEFIDATSTDFTKLWSYKVDSDTITNYTDKVKYDSTEDVYYFTAKLDNDKATADYLKVMAYQLESNMGMEVKKLEFTNLELECAVYGNGYFKYIIIHESYFMDLDGGITLSMGIDNNYINEYSFDKTEALPYEAFNKETKKIETVDFVFADRKFK